MIPQDPTLELPMSDEYMADPQDLEQMPSELMIQEEMDMMGNQDPLVDVDHYRNLADGMSQNKLDKIASDLIDLVEQDEESRDDWYKRVKEGIRNLGVSDKVNSGADFEGASKVVHPILMESVTQFQARAIQEMWPSEGPVQTRVLGPKTREKEAQAARVKDYMNYLYTVEMTEAFTEEDNMLLRLPISGSCFKKMYYHPLKERLCSTFIEPADFIVSYQTQDLRTSPRFTHRIREYSNDVKKKEASGYYIKNDKDDNTYNENLNKTDIHDEIDSSEGKRDTLSGTDKEEDRVTILEIYVDYNIENDKDEDEILKPYIITVDVDQQKVKRIQRNWRPEDEKKSKRMYFTHYKFTPGLGYYGYGFLHIIGGLSLAATGSLRSLLDAAQFANMQGGFRARDSKVPGSQKPIAPGEWREINATSEELNKAFYSLPYKEPSGTMFQLMGYLDDKARHLVGITETTSGEANPSNSPVGTTAMLLEQGTKVFTSIHKRLHEAHKEEFKIMAELIEEYMPDEGYPYLFGENEGTLLPQDFDERVDVIPVSDPNISSTAQRVAKAQSILELQAQYPDLINPRAAVRRMLVALQVTDIDELIGSEDELLQQQQQAAEKEEEMRQLDIRRQELEMEKVEAEIEKMRSEAVQRNLESMATAMESAAAAVSNEALVTAADTLLKSAGFIDLSIDENPMELPGDQFPELPPQGQGMGELSQEQGMMGPPMEEPTDVYDEPLPESIGDATMRPGTFTTINDGASVGV